MTPMRSINRRWPRALTPAALAVLLLMMVPIPREAAAQTQGLTPVTAAVIGVTTSIWPAIVAKEKGFFAENGLQLDMVTSGSSARSLQQVAAGAAQIGSSSMVDAVRVIDSGANLKVFLNSQAVGTHSLIASKNIKSVTDLKGKRVMTGGQGDITNIWWEAMARHYGLDPYKDVELLFSGSTGARMSALFAGGVDATIISPPQSFKAIQEGWTDLGPVAPYLGEFPMMIWHVNEDWAKSNEKTLLSFTKAHNKAVLYMSDPANRQEVSEILARASSSEVSDALKSWDLSMKLHAFVPDGSVTTATVNRVTATLLLSGDIKPPAKPADAYVDDRFVKAAAQ